METTAKKSGRKSQHQN